MTGARGVLGAHVMRLLGARAVPFDRRDGQDLRDAAALAEALARCDVVVHLAALHPLVAPPDADADTYHEANVVPFAALLDAARRYRTQRIVLASSTSVWRDSPAGTPARFLDETAAPDADEPYGRSKIECERMLAESGIAGVALRLARFAKPGDPQDEVRKLYRAVDPRDIATAVLRAADAPTGALYAISAPTPFRAEDAALLDSDPRAAIRSRTGREPDWVPERIGSVVVAARAERDLKWSVAYPSSLLR